MAQNSPEIFNYLPDDPMAHVSRVYLCNVVNTLDNTYFRKAIDEVERQRAIKYANEPPVIEVSKDMLELLTSMTSLNLRGSTADKRSMGCLKFGAKKRKRYSMQRELELAATVDTATVAARSQAYQDSLAKRRLPQI